MPVNQEKSFSLGKSAALTPLHYAVVTNFNRRCAGLDISFKSSGYDHRRSGNDSIFLGIGDANLAT